MDSASELVKLYADKFDLLQSGGSGPKKPAGSGPSAATVKALEELKAVIKGHLQVRRELAGCCHAPWKQTPAPLKKRNAYGSVSTVLWESRFEAKLEVGGRRHLRLTNTCVSEQHAACLLLLVIPAIHPSPNAGGVCAGAERQGQGRVCRGQACPGCRVYPAGGGRAVTAGLRAGGTGGDMTCLPCCLLWVTISLACNQRRATSQAR